MCRQPVLPPHARCCPRTPGQHGGDKTFPCPSADAGWDGCETGVAALVQADTVTCPGSNTSCAGNQCCPRTPGQHGGDKTFPCPSADAGWDGCETGVAALVQADTVTCPGSNTSCAGNQCCPRTPGQHGGDKTFPCPSADAGWDGCETGVAALVQADTVTCPGSNTSCAGNQCCPRTPGQHGGDKTFPCPSADAGWDGCETGVAALVQADTVTCPGSNTSCAGNQLLPPHGRAARGGQDFPLPERRRWLGRLRDRRRSSRAS
ncbi:unnamed protein product [Prorocentrum cordatum]|uniref:Uncharacterized protein n=1 Tax=Prorocentrum cordatum TaxID=2364126 RepID=A0ABN9WP45_9DINO|nr:unnamed protein product [Polarella glacialis]